MMTTRSLLFLFFSLFGGFTKTLLTSHASSFESSSVLSLETDDERERNKHFGRVNSHNALSGIRKFQSPLPIDPTYGPDGNSYSTDGVTIKAEKTKISGDKTPITVTVTVPKDLLNNASRTDYTSETLKRHWVGVYSPANASMLNETAPVKYSIVEKYSVAYHASGIGGLNFDLHKMREDFDFVLFSSNDPQSTHAIYHKNFSDWANILGDSQPIARSERVTFEDDKDEPIVPRIGVTKSDDQKKVSITWTSGRKDANAKVRWRYVGEANWEPTIESEPAVEVTKDQFCGAPANAFGYRHSGYQHYAEIENKVDNKRAFEYQLGDDISDFKESTRVYEGKFLPVVGASHTTLALFADMGVGTTDDSETWREYGQPGLQVAESLGDLSNDNTNKHPIDAVFLFGDLSYAVGYISVWDEFLHQMSWNFAHKIPFLVNSGNHEFDYFESGWDAHASGRTRDLYGGHDSGGECGVMSNALFNTPRKSAEKDWFGVAIGNIFVVSINTEVDFNSMSSDQHAELRMILETEFDRTKTPWLIVVGHRPGLVDSSYAEEAPASANKKDSSDVAVMKEIQEHLWPMFVEFKVDMVFWGHNHAYQRSCSLKSQLTETECSLKSKTVSENLNNVYEKPEYPISFVVGTGGAEFTKNDVNMFFTEKVVYEHGFVDLHAHNSTHLFGRFIDAVNGNRVLDSFWIIRESSSEDAMKDNTNHTAAIFFTVMLFLAVMTSIWYWYYKKNGGTATISGGLHAFSSSVKKNLFQNSRDARPRAQRFQAFADDDGDSNNEFVMADSPSPYEAPTSLRENYASKEHHHQGNESGGESIDVVDEEEGSPSRPGNNPFANF